MLRVELNILTPVWCAAGAVVLGCGGQERGGVRHQRGHSGHGDLRVRSAPRQPRVRDANPPGQRHSFITGQSHEICPRVLQTFRSSAFFSSLVDHGMARFSYVSSRGQLVRLGFCSFLDFFSLKNPSF